MGNQASVAGGTRATSVYPPHVPSHTPSGKRERRHSDQDSRARNLLTAHGVPISGVRKWSGGAGTPVTYETPPCINVKSRKPSTEDPLVDRGQNVSLSDPELDTAPTYLSISPSVKEKLASDLPDANFSNTTPIVPMSQRFLTKPDWETNESQIFRPRARTTNAVLRKEAVRGRANLVPTVFKYSMKSSADAVYLTGSMTGWRCVKMSKPEGENYWVSIHDTREGAVHYKFLVDGHWCVEQTVEKVKNKEGVEWNVIEVKKSDFEVFEALACDSFTLKNSETAKEEKKFKSDSWCQDSPDFAKLDIKMRTPPTLPPHLLQVILNRDVSYLPDPILLEEPSHVMLNHLYAQAIRDGLLVLSSTQRFRKKYVTTLLYKPI